MVIIPTLEQSYRETRYPQPQNGLIDSQKVEAALALAKAAMKQQFDKHRSESRDYKPGDLVWLEGMNIKTQRPAKKLDHLQHRPFVIIEKVGQAAYKLKLLQTPAW